MLGHLIRRLARPRTDRAPRLSDLEDAVPSASRRQEQARHALEHLLRQAVARCAGEVRVSADDHGLLVVYDHGLGAPALERISTFEDVAELVLDDLRARAGIRAPAASGAFRLLLERSHADFHVEPHGDGLRLRMALRHAA